MTSTQFAEMKKEDIFKVSILDYDCNLFCITRGMPEAELAFQELCQGAFIALNSDGAVSYAYFVEDQVALATSLTGNYYLDNFRFIPA